MRVSVSPLRLSHLLNTLQDLRGAVVIITFVTALAAASEESALSAVQLLWINLIMDTFAVRLRLRRTKLPKPCSTASRTSIFEPKK